MALNNYSCKSLLPSPTSCCLACPAPLAKKPPSVLPLPLTSSSLPQVEAEAPAAEEADGEVFTMAVANMNKPSRKWACLPRISSFLPTRATFSKFKKDPNPSQHLVRKPVPDHSNESSPSQPPHDIALALTPVDNNPLPALPLPALPLPEHLDFSLPPTPIDEIPLPSITASEPLFIAPPQPWNQLRKSRSSTQIAPEPRASSPSTRNTSPHSRVVSFPIRARPESYHSSNETFDPTKKRRSWMPGTKPGSRQASQDFSQQVKPAAWVATEQTALDYTSSLNYLRNGAKVTIPALLYCELDIDPV